jgi:hypothetical protein
MKFLTLKICSIFIVSASILFIAYRNNACSFFYDCDEWHYSFFKPEIIQQPHAESFFVSCHGLYNNNNVYSIEDSSIAEWQQYFNNNVDKAEIELLFEIDQLQFEIIENGIRTKSNVPTLELQKLTTQLTKADNLKAIEYLSLSKKIEPLVQGNSDFWSYKKDPIDTNVYRALFSQSKKLADKSNDSFLKTRYAFQALRILFYLADYNACIDFYKRNFNELKSKNSITARASSYYAGCYYRQKDYATSNYLFSKIFHQHPALKESAFLSFHPWADADWSATLAMAKSNAETETLWQLFGIYADPLKGMHEIFKINPASKMGDVLLMRSINILERDKLINNHEGMFFDLFSEDTDGHKVFDSSVSFKTYKRDDAVDSLLQFVNEHARLLKSDVWLNGAAYLNWLVHNDDVAKDFLKQLSTMPLSTLAKQQLDITNALVHYRTIKSLNPANLDSIAVLLNKINFETRQGADLFAFLSESLANRFLKEERNLMVELCRPNGKYFYKTTAQYNEMLLFMTSKNHSDFERFYLNHYPYKPHHIVEYLAVEKIKNAHFKEALVLFNSNMLAGNQQLPGNPFNIHINDCHDCDHADVQTTIYTKQSYCEKMIKILEAAHTAKDSSIKSQNYFLYANGLYNQTYYGNGRIITSTFATEAGYVAYNSKGYAIGGCDSALKYYQLAAAYATHKELKAKFTWMSAKCELNNWYAANLGKAGVDDFVAGKYFKQMKSNFNHTKYFEEVIAECGYFCTYMGLGNNCIKNNY